MKHHRLLLILLSLAFGATSAFAQANWNTSLHKTRPGKNYWYGTANGGFEQFTQVPIANIGCTACHGPSDADGNAYTGTYAPGCVDCHPSNSAFNKDSIKVSQCYGCHSRQATEANTLGYTDVHRTMGFKCWDCHTPNDMHGGPVPVESMLEVGGIEVDCEDCHTTAGGTLPDHSAYDPHGGKIHCLSCHGKTVISCYNCHFESQVATPPIKRHKQPIHGFMILANRAKDNKIYPMSFQSLTNAGVAFVAFGPFTSHTVDSVGRGCTDCHANFGGSIEAIQQYNATGQIKFATWNENDSTLSYLKGIVPMPADYQQSWKMDFLTYTGDVSNPMSGADKQWVKIGKDTWDGHQMFFATPLTKVQMAKLGFDTTKVVSVEEHPTGEVPGSFELGQNYPNPFNPSTKIDFQLPEASVVSLKVYNTLGELVLTEIEGRSMSAGNYTVTINAATLPSGVYLYQISTPSFQQTRKMVLMK